MKGVQAAKRQILFLLSLRLKGGEVKGFTLLELLAAMLIGSIITFLMLAGVINLMGTNQKEAAKSDTQRDTQAAIDYISRDLREAIYVYDGRCLTSTGTVGDRVEIPSPKVGEQPSYCSALLKFLPASINSANQLPVLAFWRVDPLPQPLKTVCIKNAGLWIDPAKASKTFLNVPCASQTTYTLVVYSLDWSNPSGIWRGRSRLKRYQLPQYPYVDPSAMDTPNVKGWITPLEKEIGFPQWPLRENTKDKTFISEQVTLGVGIPINDTDNAVLIDFIDEGLNITANCPDDGSGTLQLPKFEVTPPAGLATGAKARRSFYACVRGGASAGLNQEVIVRLQANAAGRPGIPKQGSLPITMESRVMTRGVLNKASN
jgi:prepilin-type N-terminal cleavage/methylation domain-containing protein